MAKLGKTFNKTMGGNMFKTINNEEFQKLKKQRENNITIQNRIGILRELIEDKELQCLRVYEG